MVSRRTWASISMTMAALFFLFMFTGAMKDTWNNYRVNSYYTETEFEKKDCWEASETTKEEVVLIGSKEGEKLTEIVRQWCVYTKRKMVICEKLKDYELSEENKPKLILLNSKRILYKKNIKKLQKLVNEGVNLVFCTLPKTKTLAENHELAQLIGIEAIYLEKIQILGVEFFGGFLLGGDAIYKAETQKEEEQQDFTLEVPWYQTTSGIKTYAVGLMDKDMVQNEYMPGIIWRNSIGDSRIFAINGDFLTKTEGLGILSAIVTECSDYDLYPVVNAQTLSVVNFPGFANENGEKMEEVYSRSQTKIYEDIVWPTLLSTLEKSGNKLTCLLSPQYDYTDGEEPSPKEMLYQMKLINEARGEAGLSVSRAGKLTVREKLEKDQTFLSENGNEYQFGAYYAAQEDVAQTARLQRNVAKVMTTITTDFQEGQPVISFRNENVTLQRGTANGFSHTYREDMRMRSIQTVLGYSNIVADFHKTFWPEGPDDQFEKMAEKFSSYTNTYWNRFKAFDKTTLSESDKRVRQFLVMDYREHREKNRIFVEADNVTGDSWFILRTHGESIKDVTGGEFKKIENDAYLIKVYAGHAEIKLQKEETEHFYYLTKERES